MKTITEETAATQVPAAEEQPKASKKATAGATSRARCARQGKGGQEGHPRQESAQGREKGQGRRDCQARSPRRQQDRQDPGTAQAPERRHREGTREGDRLAASFRPRVPLRNRGQEDGPDRYLDQGRGWGAHVLRRGLKPLHSVQTAPPGTNLAAFFVVLSSPPPSPERSSQGELFRKPNRAHRELQLVDDLPVGPTRFAPGSRHAKTLLCSAYPSVPDKSWRAREPEIRLSSLRASARSRWLTASSELSRWLNAAVRMHVGLSLVWPEFPPVVRGACSS